MLRLNAGFSRKVGEPDYGSRGASVNLELELESRLAEDGELLRRRVRQLFAMCRSAVDEELAGDEADEPPERGAADGPGRSDAPTAVRSSAASAARSSTVGSSESSNAAGRNGRPARRPRPATDAQLRALHAIADQQQLDLEQLVRQQFNLADAAQLTIRQASQLIDSLKPHPHESWPDESRPLDSRPQGARR